MLTVKCKSTVKYKRKKNWKRLQVNDNKCNKLEISLNNEVCAILYLFSKFYFFLETLTVSIYLTLF